jgi:hypothetical protein
MSPDEYLDSITPTAKRSALAPLAADLRYLRDKGCSIRQLRDYAQSKGIEVHLATVARFIGGLGESLKGSALPSPGSGRPGDGKSPALPGMVAPGIGQSVPHVFGETDGEIARSVLARLRARDAGQGNSKGET